MADFDSEYWIHYTKARIIELANDRHISLRQLSEAIGKGKTYLSDILNFNGNRNVSIQNLYSIMDQLNVTPQEFFDPNAIHIDLTKRATNTLNRLPESEIQLVLDLVEKLAQRYPEKNCKDA